MKHFRTNTSKIQGNKKTISFALILLLTISMIIVFAQPTLAQVGVSQPTKTVGYISVAPTLVGVGQNATVNLWIFPMPTNYAYQPYYKGFEGVTVTFIKPDGTKDTFLPVDGTGQFAPGQTQALGAIYFSYAPNVAGNWTVTFTMPAQNLTDRTGTVLYSACSSNTAHFSVQTEPVLAGLLNGYPWSPLPNPNVYWDYPISPNNREWNQISGEWLGITTVTGAGLLHWQPYGSGPNTAHIVWNQQLKAGGLIGGDYGSLSYSSGMNLGQAIIMQGKVFVNVPNTSTFECIDLTTGEIIYKTNGSVTCGVHLPGNAYTQSRYDPTVVLASSYGAIPTPYLYGTAGTTWNYYDPHTGTLMRSIVNCSSGFQLVDGTNLAYGVTSGNVTAWNISKVVNNNWPTGIEWSRKLPTPLSANAQSLFGVSTDQSTIVVTARNQFWGYSAKDGNSLWNLTLTYPVNANQETALYGVDDFIVFDPVASTFHCYSMLSGTELWISDSLADSPWATTWTVYVSEANDYNNFYVQLPDGAMRAFSLKTGKEVWRSEPILSTEYTNNAVPFVIGMVMVGGNLYGYAGYSVSYQLDPIPRHAMLVCINATTGNSTYTLNGGVYPTAASNGYLIGLGEYDGKFYGIGKGKTQTTVNAPTTAVSGETSIVIQGSVMDLSPASPNTPAISDEDMSEWMDYLHMQNATLLNNPPTPNGVTVRIAAMDNNGQVTDLGTTTSDYTGQFSLQWKPTTEGMYKIFATFDGSNSYFGSFAETALSINEAPTETSTQQQVVVPDYTMTLIVGFLAVIIAVAIGVVLLYRKK